MAKGRKKTPVSMKATRGTLRKDRMPENMPVPSFESMQPVALVNDRVKGSFDFLHGLVAMMGNDSATFGVALSIAALRMDRAIRLAEELEVEGDTYETIGRNGRQIKENPKVRILSEELHKMMSILTEFGMTPAAIQKVGSANPQAKDNPFLKFR